MGHRRLDVGRKRREGSIRTIRAAITAILRESVRIPVGPEFMAPPVRETAVPVAVGVG